jgi:hypothetical protein
MEAIPQKCGNPIAVSAIARAATRARLVLGSKAKPVGFSFTPKSDKTVRYDGTAVEVKM